MPIDRNTPGQNHFRQVGTALGQLLFRPDIVEDSRQFPAFLITHPVQYRFIQIQFVLGRMGACADQTLV